MSFSSQAKKELTNLTINKIPNIQSELAAFLRINGSMHLGFDSYFEVYSQNPAIARHIHFLISKLFPQAEISTEVFSKSKNTNRYSIAVKNYQSLLQDLDIDVFAGNQVVPQRFLNNQDQIFSFLRGVFLASGSVNQPLANNYHLEVFISDRSLALQIVELIRDLNLNAKMTTRRAGQVIYLKKAEEISDFLSAIGATNSMLKFEDTRIMRDMRNSVNRLVNAETANLQRTIEASSRQIEAIKRIDQKIGLDQLPDNLKQLANLRLENPELPLVELGNLIKDNPISKSGVNHRMRKLLSFDQ